MKYILIACLLLSFPAAAQDKMPERPALKALQKRVKDMTAELSDTNKSHFGQIYGTYSLINTVEVVRGDVENAVESCGAENPDLKTPMTARYNTWIDAIVPVMDEANGKIDNMVAVQDYAKKKAFNRLFKAIENARDESGGLVDKRPVTTEKACKKLLKKMDGTQKQLVSLLRQTLVSYPAEKE